jgi:DNA-directed RNA polymerase beta' subunit
MAAKTVAKLQTIEKAASTATETVTLSKKVIKNGQEVIEKIQMAKEAYETIDSYANLYSENFAGQTTSEINTTIDAKFNPAQAKAIKKAWAQVAVSELAYANGITMAQNAMSVMSLVGMVDPIGLTDVVAAYTHPICAAGNKFPALSKNYK